MTRIKISGAGNTNNIAAKLMFFSTLLGANNNLHKKHKTNSDKKTIHNIPLRERLTDLKLHNMFGENYRNIICYNFDNKLWNKSTLLNYDILNRQDTIQYAKLAKLTIEHNPDFKNFEVVAFVITIIPAQQHLFIGNFIERPHFTNDATAIAGNIICRNRKTGRIMPMSDFWLAGRGYTEQRHTVAHGADDFIHDCWGLPQYQQALLRLNNYER